MTIRKGSAIQTGIPTATSRDPTINEVVSNHGSDPDHLLPILQTLHEGHLPFDQNSLTQVAQQLSIPAARVKGVATFYSMLKDSPLAEQTTIRLCDGVVCWLKDAGQAKAEMATIEPQADGQNVVRTSCLGQCDKAPAAFVGLCAVGPITSDQELLSESLDDSTSIPVANSAHPREQRLLLNNAGHIDPFSIDDAIRAGVYDGLKRAIEVGPHMVLDEIERSGLTGRGGAGFPTGRKWKLVANAVQTQRYVVCNADESEPLMFKDRVLLESDPHSVIEGILLAGFSVGAQRGFIYIRGEYEHQAQIIEQAIAQAHEHRLLGDEILGSKFSFELEVHRGAGAYICGEETALLESLEGLRGEPRLRPPYPAVAGYHGAPTLVNNVETLATASAIVRIGAEEYLQIGQSSFPGTRLFTLLGHVNRTGLIELPYGFTLREMIEEVGGGMNGTANFGCALTGGAAGTIVGDEQLDVPFDHQAARHGVSLGSGGILICDDSISPVALLRELMWFFEMESCGKCTPCRIGTHVARETLDRLLRGTGTSADVQRLRDLIPTLKTSFCGLGTSAADPLNSCLANFPEHFESLVTS